MAALPVAGFPELFQFFEAIEACANGAEIGQRSTEPALRDVMHSASRGFFLDRMAGLALGADEQDIACRWQRFAG